MEQRIEVGSMIKLKGGMTDKHYYGLCAWFKDFDSIVGKYIQVDKKIEVLPYKYVYTLKDVDTMLLVTPEMIENVINDFKCEKCGKKVEVGDGVYVNNKVWCKECAKEEFTCCSECGEPITKEVFTVDGKTLCKDCFDKKYIMYGGVIYSKDVCTIVDDVLIPNDELEEKAFKCVKCGKWHLKSSKSTVEYNICNECWKELPSLVKTYHHYESDFWNVHKIDDENTSKIPTMGVELEVEKSGGDYSHKEVSYLIHDKFDDFLVFESDGSLDNGFEIISQPMTLKYAYNLGKLQKLFEILQKTKFKDSSNTGLHIHVGRECLGKTDTERDETITKICVILETFQKEVCNFARRNSNGYCRFLTDENGNKTLKYIKRNRGGDRYTVLNENNYSTIEFRIFKATDDYETFMATLELVNNIVTIARDVDINGMKWNDIINYGTNNKFLKAYDDKVNHATETVIQLASNLELHKENYTFKKFVNGEFGMHLRDTSRVSRLANFFVGNLYSVGVTHHGVYDDMQDCLLRKASDCRNICVREYDGKLRLVSEMGDITDVQDFEDVYDMWIDNYEMFKIS